MQIKVEVAENERKNMLVSLADILYIAFENIISLSNPLITSVHILRRYPNIANRNSGITAEEIEIYYRSLSLIIKSFNQPSYVIITKYYFKTKKGLKIERQAHYC